MRCLWTISFVAILSISTNYVQCDKSPKKQVCVIGAGLAGLVSAKYLADYPDEFELVVFEKNSDVGGLWIYTDSTTIDEHGLPVHSSIYKNVRANSPKNFVFFPDFPEFKGENRSYAIHWDMHQYFRNFTDYYDLWQYIKFNTNVEKVIPLNNMRWLVMAKNLNTNKRIRKICDAVMVANGQDVKPNIPKINGIESFSGKVLHSHFYRKPEGFANQTVVILGAGVSGLELTADMHGFAKTIYLSHRHDKLTSKLPENVKQIVGVTGADGDELILSDGSRIKADVLLLCTGYIFDYPFLDANSGITIEADGKYIRYVYKHLINVERPTMALLNVPTPGIRNIIPRFQAQYFVAVLRGKVKLPSKRIMMKEARPQPGTPKNKYHYMLEGTFPYLNQLAATAGINPLPPYVEPGILEVHKRVINDPIHYKEQNVIIHDDGSFEFVDI